MAYIEGKDRKAIKFNCLEDYIKDDNEVRVIDAFVDSYKKPFGKEKEKVAGRNAFNPKTMMKLFVYGYIHNIRSSRKLAEACKINLEVRWLLEELEPDFRTISYFRKDNVEAIKEMFYSFLEKIKPEVELGYQSIDGSKIQANNGKDKNFTLQKLDDGIAWKKAHIEEFLRQIDVNDIIEGDIIDGELTKDELLDKIDKYKEIIAKYEHYRDRMEKESLSQLSLTDEDAKLMKFKQEFQVGYNMQTAVDSNTHLITDFKATNHPTDHGMLESTVKTLKEKSFKDKPLELVADKGYIKHDDMSKCLEEGIIPNVILPDGKDTIDLEFEYKENKNINNKSTKKKEISKCLHSGIIPKIYKDRIDEIEIVDKKVKVEKKLTNSKYNTEVEMIKRALEGFFVRDPERNVVYCPGNEKLRCTSIKSRGEIKYANKLACSRCPYKSQCVKGNRKWKEIEFTKDSLETVAKWHKNYDANKGKSKRVKNTNFKIVKVVKIKFRPNKEKMDKRKNLSEHPFGTIKRSLGGTYFLLRGLKNIAAEFSLLCLGYNIKRAINYIGYKKVLNLVSK